MLAGACVAPPPLLWLYGLLHFGAIGSASRHSFLNAMFFLTGLFEIYL